MLNWHWKRKLEPTWKIATPVASPNRAMRSFITPMFRGIALDQPERLRRAWKAIFEHPSYPHDQGPLVTADDVEDPQLRAMLVAFDRMPVVPGPQGGRFDLGDPYQLATVKTGWMRGGFDEDGLWPEPADPREILRRVIRRQAEADYESIIDGSAASKVTGDPS